LNHNSTDIILRTSGVEYPCVSKGFHMLVLYLIGKRNNNLFISNPYNINLKGFLVAIE